MLNVRKQGYRNHCNAIWPPLWFYYQPKRTNANHKKKNNRLSGSLDHRKVPTLRLPLACGCLTNEAVVSSCARAGERATVQCHVSHEL